MEKEAKLILLRHGQSQWNKKNIFTGWVDVSLSKDGIEEATQAGYAIRAISIDVIFISSLIRSQLTAMIAMAENHSNKVPLIVHHGEGNLEEWGKIYDQQAKENTIPVYKAWQINERMYGILQGLEKHATEKRFGVDQVKIWRRSFDTSPPQGESLEMTQQRVLPYFKNFIFPRLKKGDNVLVCAHGNSLRSIVMHLDHLSKTTVLNLEIPPAIPLCYSFKGDYWKKETI